jgi:PEGA domain
VKKLAPIALAFAALAAFAPRVADAQAPAALNQAKMLFNAGSQAYDLAHYDVAIQAFEGAYKLVPRPAILFAIAQAARKEWVATQQTAPLRKAVETYRAYLAAEKDGPRAAEAVTALADLQPELDARDKSNGSAPAPPPTSTEATPTRILVSVEAPDAMISMDGGAPARAPLISDVAAGKHHVHITAPGFYDEEHDVVAVANALVPFDFSPNERPAIARVVAEDGSEIAIDGRPVGKTPLPRPLEIAPGAHLIAVTKRGYDGFSYSATFGRGETVTIPVKYERSSERIASYAFLGAAGVGAITGAVFTIVSFSEQSRAQNVLTAQAKGNIQSSDLSTYASAVDARDRWKGAAEISFGAGAALLATGAVLYFFDQPSMTAAVQGPEQPAPKPAPQKATPSMEMGAAPMIGPGLYGLGLRGSF